MDKKTKKKFSRQQTKKMVPALKEFNSMAKAFLKLLHKKIEQKEKRISNIAVLVNEMAIPQSHYSINIQTIDINQTTVRKKGKMSFNKSMDWEQDYRKRNKGLLL
jgi:hypothetical protein